MKNNTLILTLLVLVGAALVAVPLIQGAQATLLIQSSKQQCVNNSCSATSFSNPPGQCTTTKTAHSITTICRSR